MKYPQLAILIPCHNHQENIVQTIEQVQHFGSVIVIDNASTDNSYHFDGAIDAIQVCMPAVQRQPTCEGLISQLAASEGPRSALPEIIPLPHLPIRADANVAGTGRCCCRCR